MSITNYDRNRAAKCITPFIVRALMNMLKLDDVNRILAAKTKLDEAHDEYTLTVRDAIKEVMPKTGGW